MKIYTTQQEVEKDIKNGVLAIEGDVKFKCSITIRASIKVTDGDITAWDITAGNITAWDITARDITAGNITAWDITARDINARNITAGNITAGDITARDINAGNITARDINAGNIYAGDINARNILYYAFCCVYKSIKCLSIKSTRDLHREPICLEGSLEIKKKEEGLSGKKVSVELDKQILIEMFKRSKMDFKIKENALIVEAGYIGFISYFTFNKDNSLRSIDASE